MQLKKNVARDMISDVKISIFCYNGNEEMNLKIEGGCNHGRRGSEFIKLCCSLHQ